MISVIIPAFNEELYIEGCINSLKSQITTTPYEIIVVDNNSTDNTAQKAKSARVTIIHEAKQGPAFAKNAGAKIAKGDILCFIDADCIVPNDHLEKLVHLFNKFPEVSAMGGRHEYDDGGEIVKFLTCQLNYFYYYFKCIYYLTGVLAISGGNMAVKREVFEKIGGFNETMDSVLKPEDFEFSIRLHKNGYQAKLFKELRGTSSFRRYKGKANIEGFVRFFESVKVARQIS